MENHRCRIKLKRLIWYDAGVVPTLFFIVVNDQHVIGIMNAKAEVASSGFALGVVVRCVVICSMVASLFLYKICTLLL